MSSNTPVVGEEITARVMADQTMSEEHGTANVSWGDETVDHSSYGYFGAGDTVVFKHCWQASGTYIVQAWFSLTNPNVGGSFWSEPETVAVTGDPAFLQLP